MNRIEHLIEPNRLLLVWQRPLSDDQRRSRRIVAEIRSNGGEAVLRYLTGTEDFKKACSEGFIGFPAFKLETRSEEHREGVLDAFTRRLPPRKREDFAAYLAQYRLPENFTGSDMAFLAYTGAKLPSDGFELVPDLTTATPPLEFVIEVAGFRHQDVPRTAIAIGDRVRFVPEPGNQYDPQAVAVEHSMGRIGYVAGPYCGAVSAWLKAFSVEATIERINGKPERPLVYLFVKVS